MAFFKNGTAGPYDTREEMMGKEEIYECTCGAEGPDTCDCGGWDEPDLNEYLDDPTYNPPLK